MTRPLRIALVLIVLVGAALLLLLIDDDLSDESRQLIATAQARAASSTPEPYQYLFGISAPLHCALKEPGCVEQIMGLRNQWGSEVAEQRVLLERYETFVKFDNFATPLNTFSIEHPFPDYSYLTRGNRLKLLFALMAADQRGGEAGLSVLIEDLGHLRRQLASADTLIHKMMFVVLVANDLDALVHIYKHYPTRHAHVLEHLSAAELRFDSPLTREFYFGYRVFLNADGKTDFFSEGAHLPRGLGRFLYKPNMTINDRACAFREPLRVAQTNSEQFALEVRQSQTSPPDGGFKWGCIRNVVGATLGQVAAPDFQKYIARLHDLNVKFVLAQHVLSGQPGSPANPYGNTYGAKQADRSICMDGPLEDERRLRCVAW